MIIISQNTINDDGEVSSITNLWFLGYSYLIRIKIKLFIVKQCITKGKYYMKWISENERNVTQKIPFKYMPLISVIIPVYNVEETFLRECIESVLEQNYTNWELCIADDNSSDLNIKLILEEYKLKDSRVKVIYRTRNGHISACSNTALDLVTGNIQHS